MQITFGQMDNLIDSSPKFWRSKNARKNFAKQLTDRLQYWSYYEMESFIDEMKGLDLSKPDDRKTFILFFETAFPGVLA